MSMHHPLEHSVAGLMTSHPPRVRGNSLWLFLPVRDSIERLFPLAAMIPNKISRPSTKYVKCPGVSAERSAGGGVASVR